jgi:hypothetical protein
MDTRHGFRALLAFAAVALATAVSTGAASAAPAAVTQATPNCWLQVVNDWLDNNRVDRTYPIPCYTQAIQHLDAYPDVQNYSSAADDIQRALLAAIRQDRGGGPGSGSSNDGGGSSPSGSSDSGGSTPPSGDSPPNESLFHRAASSVGPSDAQSVPLPLLVLGGLALLLLLAAGGTWLARRLQARRMPPPAAKQP